MELNEIEVNECLSLALVSDAQMELAHGLNSMGGKMMENALDRYLDFGGTHTNEIVDAYVLLRQTRRFKASKVLVRPAIESFVRMAALHKYPELLYRVVYGERRSRNIWLKAWARRVTAADDSQQEEHDWQLFKQHCLNHIPSTDTTDAELSVEALAAAVGLQAFYDQHYRVYSNFTHATLIAFTRQLDWLTDSEDNRVVAICAVGVVEVLAARGAKTPHLATLTTRLSELQAAKIPSPSNVSSVDLLN